MLEAFVGHMRNDFNTSGALGALSKPLGEVNGLLDSGKGVSKAARYLTIERFVSDMEQVAADPGLLRPGSRPVAARAPGREGRPHGAGYRPGRGTAGSSARPPAAAKDWAAADRIRDELTGLGVGVQDGPEGSILVVYLILKACLARSCSDHSPLEVHART